MIACNISPKLFEDGYFHWRTPHPTSIGIAPHGPELTPSTQMWKTLVIYYICIHKVDVDDIMGSEPWGNQLMHGGARHFWTVHEGSAGIDGRFWFTMILHIVFLSIMIHHDASRSSMTFHDALWCLSIYHEWFNLTGPRRWEIAVLVIVGPSNRREEPFRLEKCGIMFISVYRFDIFWYIHTTGRQRERERQRHFTLLSLWEHTIALWC